MRNISRWPSIVKRVTRTQLLMALLWALMLSVLVRQVVHYEVDELMDQALHESATTLRGLLGRLEGVERSQIPAITHPVDQEDLVWQVIDASTGRVVDRSYTAPVKPLLLELSPHISNTPDGWWRVATLPFTAHSQHFLLVAQREAERMDARTEVATYTLISALLIGMLAVVLLNVLVRRELKPLSVLSQVVKTYDPMQGKTALETPHRAELEPMVHAIRDLGSRLARRITSERAFAAHAAHALRTPLAGIDIQLAMALKEAPESLKPRLMRCRFVAARLGHVMQALLAMFRSGHEPQRKWVQVSELLAPMVFDQLQLEIQTDLPLYVDPDLLSAVLFNLLDNSGRHGASRVVLIADKDNEGHRLCLYDDGQGCPVDQRQRLRQALAHQDYSSDSGFKGLGLILADLVMRAHGGQVELPAVERGFGVELRWPT